jgi:hypothetical protein
VPRRGRGARSTAPGGGKALDARAVADQGAKLHASPAVGDGRGEAAWGRGVGPRVSTGKLKARRISPAHGRYRQRAPARLGGGFAFASSVFGVLMGGGWSATMTRGRT